jgi:outer membrane lipoprotein-sorting protein
MTTLIAATVLSFSPQTADIMDYVQSGLRDASFVARVVRGDQRELRKINEDFGNSYRFESVRIRALDPFMLRLEAEVDDTNILYIVNGPILQIRIPRARVNSKQNLRDAPGRRQTWMDFGILTPSLFREFFSAKFVRKDRATGDMVFDLTYGEKHVDDTSRHRVWIDPERKIVSKREWYNQPGQQIATFTYENPVRENGVWLPTQVTVRNADNRVAGITRYSAFKVNTGLDKALFGVD